MMVLLLHISEGWMALNSGHMKTILLLVKPRTKSKKMTRQIATVDKHIKTVDDIKGMNIRTSPSEIERGIVSSFGANPITLPIGDVYTALQTGTIDGEGLPFTDMHA